MTFKITVKPIIPRNLGLDEKSINTAVENSLTQTALAIKADFGVTTQTWDNKPVFKIEKSPYKRVIYTENLIYLFLDEGTKKNYPIRPKNAPFLVFRSRGGGYSTKTRSGQIASYPGGKASGHLNKRKEVIHPGIEARKFSESIAKKWGNEWPKQMDRALAAVVR
jgi:hypothetical protein